MHKKASTDYAFLKGRIVAQGHTLRSWALQHGYCPSTVYSAAQGKRSGVKATKIQRELKELTNG